MKNYVEYDKIHQQQAVDEPEKNWQAREIAFGKPPVTEANSDSPSPAPSAPPEAQTHSDTKRHDVGENPPLANVEISDSVKSAPSAITPADESTINGQTHSDTKRHDLQEFTPPNGNPPGNSNNQ